VRSSSDRLSPPVDDRRDHIWGDGDAVIEVVEYGDYECPHCRAAHIDLKRAKRQLGGRWKYVFRHLPNPQLHPRAELAAEAAEAAAAQGKFWEMHDALLTDTRTLDRDTLLALATQLGLDANKFGADLDSRRFARRVQEDIESAVRGGAHGTPTFFLNGRRYDGAWDTEALREAIEEPLGFRLRRASRDFAGLPASSGALLLAGAFLALLWANLPLGGSGYEGFWESPLRIALGGRGLELPLREWVNQGLMALFFFVVALEVKREVTLGQLKSARRALLPLAAAIGGLVVPVILYASLNEEGPGARGWGVPMASDTAFVLGLLALLGSRVPLPLKIFVAALAVADDVGAILVIAILYTSHLSVPALAFSAGVLALAYVLNRARVYRALPYAVLGVLLWLGIFLSGVHATLAGVLLAIVIPTRDPPAPSGLLNQSTAAFKALEAPLPGQTDETRYDAVVRALETVVERLLSPARRLERDLQPWSAYFVLPLVALANAGVELNVRMGEFLSPLSLGTVLGLVVGKPLGILAMCAVLVRLGVADLPLGVTRRHLLGAACLCGVGFSESIFFADAAFAGTDLLALSKLSVFVASLVAATLGWIVLRGASDEQSSGQTPLGGAAAVPELPS
jgi:Na+:H+ antiporter, NhaA family